MFRHLARLCRPSRSVLLAALAVSISGASIPASSVRAQEMDRIAAVINDDIVSIRELDGRVRMALAFSNLPDNQDSRRRVIPQVLRKMIDERLQMQESARLKISLGSGELENGIAMIEQQNRLPKGGLLGRLQAQGVDPQLVREQIRADMTWMRLTGRVLQSQIRVGDEEINDRMEIIKERQGKPEYLLAEIQLPVDNPNQDNDARQLGERLAEQLRQGAPFQALASQFSRAPSAANGGTMGWLALDALDDEYRDAVQNLTKGQITPLIRSGTGYAILAMIDQRIAGQTANPDDAQVVVGTMTLPVPAGAPPKQELMGRAANLVAQAKSCSDLEAIAKKAEGTFKKGQTQRLGELEQGLRSLLLTRPAGQASTPTDVPEGIQIAMLCSREESTTVSLPSREQVRRGLEDERMDMLSRRYIRDLRRSAFIDVRI